MRILAVLALLVVAAVGCGGEDDPNKRGDNMLSADAGNCPTGADRANFFRTCDSSGRFSLCGGDDLSRDYSGMTVGCASGGFVLGNDSLASCVAACP